MTARYAWMKTPARVIERHNRLNAESRINTMNMKARYNRRLRHGLARKLFTVFLAGQVFFGNVFTASAAPVNGTITDVVVQFEYDGNGNVTARHDGNGNVIGYEYDELFRLTGIDYPGGNSPDVTFVYGIDGNLSEMHDDTGITYYGYDQLGRPTTYRLLVAIPE